MTDNNNEIGIHKISKRKAIWIKRLWGLLPVFILVILVMLLGGLVGDKKEEIEVARINEMKKVEEKINVVTLDLSKGTIRDKMNLPGMVMAWADLKIMSEVRGKVVAIRVDDGATVKKGTLLIQLDDRDYQNTLKAARARFSAAEANMMRISTLYKQELATQGQYDAALAERDALIAILDSAELNVERCSIRAPFAGVLNRVLIENGQLINPSDPVAELIDIDRVKVVVGIPESDIGRVKRINRFAVTIDANGTESVEAHRHSVSSKADPSAHLYTMELKVDNRGHNILPDMFARVEIVKRQVDDAISIPLFAVISQGDEHHVFVTDSASAGGDIRAKREQVTLGIQEGWLVEVTSGLEAGDTLIVVGQRGLSDNQLLSVVRSSSNIEDVVR